MHEPRPHARGPSSAPGRMTAVMRAVPAASERILRVGIVRAGRMLEERVLRQGALSVGPGERADIVLPRGDLPGVHKLLAKRDGRWLLSLGPGVRGRVASANGVLELGAASPPLELEEDARGKIVIGTTTLLFQLVPAPPVQARPQLPLSVLRQNRNADWGTMLIAALSFLLHFGALGALFSDWMDPVVDDGIVVSGLVDSIHNAPAPPQVEFPASTGPAETGAPAAKTPPKSSTHSAHAGHGTHASAGESSSSARLDKQLEAIEMKTLAALGSDAPATAGVLDGSEVPTTALDATAKSSAGVTSADPFHVGSSGAPIHPGQTTGGLENIGTRRGAQDRSTGRVQHVKGPKPSVTAQSTTRVGTVSDAASVVAGLKGRFHACYRRELEKNPEAQGRVTLTLEIGAGGGVRNVVTQKSGNLSSGVVSCMAGSARNAQFSAPTEGSAVVIVPVSLVLNR